MLDQDSFMQEWLFRIVRITGQEDTVFPNLPAGDYVITRCDYNRVPAQMVADLVVSRLVLRSSSGTYFVEMPDEYLPKLEQSLPIIGDIYFKEYWAEVSRLSGGNQQQVDNAMNWLVDTVLDYVNGWAGTVELTGPANAFRIRVKENRHSKAGLSNGGPK